MHPARPSLFMPLICQKPAKKNLCLYLCFLFIWICFVFFFTPPVTRPSLFIPLICEKWFKKCLYCVCNRICACIFVWPFIRIWILSSRPARPSVYVFLLSKESCYYCLSLYFDLDFCHAPCQTLSIYAFHLSKARKKYCWCPHKTISLSPPSVMEINIKIWNKLE